MNEQNKNEPNKNIRALENIIASNRMCLSNKRIIMMLRIARKRGSFYFSDKKKGTKDTTTAGPAVKLNDVVCKGE